MLTATLIDKYGRKPIICVASILFALGSIVLAFSYSVAMLIIGRLIVGTGIGVAANIVPGVLYFIIISNQSISICCRNFAYCGTLIVRIFHLCSTEPWFPSHYQSNVYNNWAIYILFSKPSKIVN